MTGPDLTTEVVGYRQWYVTSDLDLRAAGFGKGGVWTPGANTAKCGRMTRPSLPSFGSSIHYGEYETPKPNPCGDTPGHDCQCGFYALHDPSDFWYGPRQAASAFTQAMVRETSDPLISGVVVAWGKLEVHHQGFRAEHARIAALALPDGKRDAAVARAAAAAYGALCVPVAELPQIAAEFGTTVPQEMRPRKKPKPKPEDEYLRFMRAMQQQIATTQASTSNWGSAWSYEPPSRKPRWWSRWGY